MNDLSCLCIDNGEFDLGRNFLVVNPQGDWTSRRRRGRHCVFVLHCLKKENVYQNDVLMVYGGLDLSLAISY